MEKELEQFINHYGLDKTLRKFQEEVDELKEQIILTKNNIGSIDNLTEEYADVLNVLEQFKIYFNLDNEKINNIRQHKIDRQIKKIKNGE